MNLALTRQRIITTDDRRVLGAFQFVDAVTGLPLPVPATFEIRRASVAGQPDLSMDAAAVRVLQNRRGLHVLMRAPFFERYAESFANPEAPPETAGGPIGLHVDVTDAGPHYLPQSFRFDLPRSLDPGDDASVLRPVQVRLFRSPNAPIQDGWAVLRVSVVEAGTNPPRPLPGVLVRAYRSPRGQNDAPVGEGITEWRRNVRGDALVPIPGLQRFRPGAGPNVIESDHRIVLETTRDTGFTGADGQHPDVSRLTTGTAPGVIRATTTAPQPALEMLRPEGPLRVQPGREYVVELAMP